MKKLIIFLTVLISSACQVNAQEKTNKEKKGDNYFFVYLYKEAIDAYTNSEVLTTDGQRKLAKSYHKIDSNDLAEKVYENLIYATGGKVAEDYFDYAMVLKSRGKYYESNKQMEKFKGLMPNDLRAIDYNANKSNLNALLTDNGKSIVQNSVVNTNAQDFGPAYYKDKIVFASSRSSLQMPKKSNINNLPFLNLYISEVSSGSMQTPIEFDKSLNGSMNEGPASFNKEGTLMAYTQNNYELTNEELIVKLQIIFKTYQDGKWSTLEPFLLNNKKYSVGHANLSANGNTMYFASDMPGGYGGSDLYRISKDGNGSWGKEENLGTKINTEGDELYPFFEEKSGTLFFTSNGRFGLGGYDIFINKTNSNGFQTSVNAGAPLNTQYDDFAAIVDDKMSKYYFTSNRQGGKGNDDIYTMEIPEKTNTLEELVKLMTIEPKKEDASILEASIKAKNLKEGDNLAKVLNFNNIYFDFDKSNIRHDAIETLNNIVSIMNSYPEMVVELRAHTDCRDSEIYNQLLSNRRAKSCVDYIKERITDPSRITGKGLGKSRLLNNCICEDGISSCLEKYHQENRRTEFIIVKK